MIYRDVYRQPLYGLKDLTEENGELCIRDTCIYAGMLHGSMFYYCQMGEGNPFDNLQTDGSILHCYDTKTGRSEAVFDYSDKSGILWTVQDINRKYILMSAITEQGDTYWERSIIDRETGNRYTLKY